MRTCSYPLPFGLSFVCDYFLLPFLAELRFTSTMAEIRSSSWFEFLCEGTPSSLPRGVSVPPTTVEQFPEEVETRMMYLEDTRQQICPGIQELRSTEQLPIFTPRLRRWQLGGSQFVVPQVVSRHLPTWHWLLEPTWKYIRRCDADCEPSPGTTSWTPISFLV